MITKELINPQSIVVVGASNDIEKPGGKILKNLLDGNYKGKLFATNLKENVVQGIKAYKHLNELPQVELAIIAIAAKFVAETVKILIQQKGTKAFVILSAGFSELNEEGKAMENEIVSLINEAGASLIGPNCIGILNNNYQGVFTEPIPKLDPQGCELISASGATACFILEAGIPKGLTFSSVYSVGNSAQIGVEEILEYMDESFDPETSSKIKLLYIESVDNPQKLLKHASSLVRKGCMIAGVKAGASEAGSRAASSHTGALASPDVAVSALFKKAGIVRCYGREDILNVAGVFMHKELKGKNIAIITHAGGPGVMLTDTLEKNGLVVPEISGPDAEELLTHLHPGSSVSNPIDFLATGTAEHLGTIIDYVDQKFDHIDAMVVIFGTPGLFPIHDVYKILHDKIRDCKKPIYPVLPSVKTSYEEIQVFLSKANINFSDEVLLGKSLSRVYNTPKQAPVEFEIPEVDTKTIRQVVDNAGNGYLAPAEMQKLLDAAGIARANERIVKTKEEALQCAKEFGYPLVMKVIGPIHKSDVGGVVLDVMDEETVAKEFDRLIQIKDTTAVLMYPMLFGTEIFIGAKREEGFGHLILSGLGGIFIEVLKDVREGLVPISKQEARCIIRGLKGYGIINGARNQEPVNEEIYIETIMRVSALVQASPEIFELDLNPLLGTKNSLTAVDCRIRIEKD